MGGRAVAGTVGKSEPEHQFGYEFCLLALLWRDVGSIEILLVVEAKVSIEFALWEEVERESGREAMALGIRQFLPAHIVVARQIG